MSIRKKFDKELYAQCDTTAKQKAIEIMSKKGYDCKENTKRTQVDLVVFEDSEIKFYIEVEQKLVWKTDKFPYDSINFPSRKEKFTKLEKPTLFIMFNYDLSQYLCITGEDLITSNLEIVRNKYVPYGEYFFKVSLDKAVFNEIKGV